MASFHHAAAAIAMAARHEALKMFRVPPIHRGDVALFRKPGAKTPERIQKNVRNGW